MTMIFENRNTDYDGSPTGLNEIQSAAGAVVVTYSGTLDVRDAVSDRPILGVFSRSDTAEYSPTYSRQDGFGRFRVNLASGDDYYFTLTGVNASDSIDLSVVAG